jgi:regulator of protease activity HflC (stomatin/prohibitin superfamily)
MTREIRFPGRPRIATRWLVVLIVIFVLLVAVGSALKRVEPGFAGVKIDYAKGQTAGPTGYAVEQVPAGRFVFINPITQRLAQYPISNQNLTMARRVTEGKVQGDDSVKVVDTNGVTLNIDVSAIYRVNPQEVGAQLRSQPQLPPDLCHRQGQDSAGSGGCAASVSGAEAH